MPSIKLPYKRVKADEGKYGKGFGLNSLSKADYQSFNASVLGLGDIAKDGKYVQALAAFYDLQGFTSFSNQLDSHLVIPEFLKSFLEWLFSSLGKAFKEGESEGRVRLFGSLPFFSKFMGDGLLLLWDTEYSGGQSGLENIVWRLRRVKDLYSREFLPKIRTHVSKPPARLRCGVARGQIISIGEGNDYVGSCINLASRLQKLNQLSFAVSRRGFDLSKSPLKAAQSVVLKKVELPGLGKEELVYVLKEEFDALKARDRKLFQEP